jgi:hypothetical protein
MEIDMYPARHPRDSRIDPLLTLTRALVFASATAVGCGLVATASAATDDKGKAVAEAPDKSKPVVPAPTKDKPASDVSAKDKVGSDAPAKADPPSVTITPPGAKAPTITISGAIDSSDAKTDSTQSTDKRFPRRRGHIQIGGDDDFNSFNEALHTAPWVVGLAFLVAGTVFLTPIILLFGIIWYKLRKTRLQNDAVLRLAEKGVMPPAQAVDAVMSGVSPESMAASAIPIRSSAAAPVYEQAVISRRRAVWSDLRKGVILTAIGLAFLFYSMINSGEANWVGLVLLFLGVGYILLWWFEDRHLQRRETDVRAGTDIGKS